MRHDPTVLRAQGRTWARCSCGWRSRDYLGPIGSSIEFSRHLATESSDESEEQG